MRYPNVRYIEVEHDDELELHLMDGTSRRVTFASRDAREAALAPGRSEIDAAALISGRMPFGATGISHVAARPTDELLRETFEIIHPSSYSGREADRIRLSTARAVAAAEPASAAYGTGWAGH